MEPKICLALGGGAARGLAHLGVLKVFEDARVPIHMRCAAARVSAVACPRIAPSAVPARPPGAA
jgi:NTE family protein